jgi:hypothetical protein
MQAAALDSLAVVRGLIEHGASIGTVDDDGRTAYEPHILLGLFPLNSTRLRPWHGSILCSPSSGNRVVGRRSRALVYL